MTIRPLSFVSEAMRMPTPTVFSDWAQAVALLAGAFWIWKIRREEVLRTRLSAVIDIYTSFSALNDAVASWTRILSDGKNHQRFNEAMVELDPKLQDALHRSWLLLDPETSRRLATLLKLVRDLRHAESEIKQELSAPPEHRDGAAQNKARKQFYIDLPERMRLEHENLLFQLQAFLHGTLWAQWWRLRRKRMLGGKRAA